jgi:hypothetical protein
VTILTAANFIASLIVAFLSYALPVGRKSKRKKNKAKQQGRKFFLSTQFLHAIQKYMLHHTVFEYSMRMNLPRDEIFYLEQQYYTFRTNADTLKREFLLTFEENKDFLFSVENVGQIVMVYESLDPLPLLSGDLKNKILSSSSISSEEENNDSSFPNLLSAERIAHWLRIQFFIKQIVVQIGSLHGLIWKLDVLQNMMNSDSNLFSISEYGKCSMFVFYSLMIIFSYLILLSLDSQRPVSNPDFYQQQQASTFSFGNSAGGGGNGLGGGSILFSQSSKQLPPLKFTEKKKRKLGFDESFSRQTPRILHYQASGMKNNLQQASLTSSASVGSYKPALSDIDQLRKELQIAQSGVNELNKMVDTNIAWVQSNCEINDKFQNLSNRAIQKCKNMAMKKMLAIFDSGVKRFLKKQFITWKLSIHYQSLEAFAKTYVKLKSVVSFQKIFAAHYYKRLYSSLNKWLKNVRFEILMERNASIVQIQRVIRGFISRRRYAQKKLGKTVTHIQSLFRYVKAKKKVAALRTTDWGARVIQKWFKSWYKIRMAKKELKKRKGQRAAVRIQALFRGGKTRDDRIAAEKLKKEKEEAEERARQGEEQFGGDLDALAAQSSKSSKKKSPSPKKKQAAATVSRNPLRELAKSSKTAAVPLPAKKPPKPVAAGKKNISGKSEKKKTGEESTNQTQSLPQEGEESTNITTTTLPLALETASSPTATTTTGHSLVPPLLSPLPTPAVSHGVEIGIQVTFREEEEQQAALTPNKSSRNISKPSSSPQKKNIKELQMPGSPHSIQDSATSPFDTRPHTPEDTKTSAGNSNRATIRKGAGQQHSRQPSRPDSATSASSSATNTTAPATTHSKPAAGHSHHDKASDKGGKKSTRTAAADSKGTGSTNNSKRSVHDKSGPRSQSLSSASTHVPETQAVKIQKIARGKLARIKSKKITTEETNTEETEEKSVPEPAMMMERVDEVSLEVSLEGSSVKAGGEGGIGLDQEGGGEEEEERGEEVILSLPSDRFSRSRSQDPYQHSSSLDHHQQPVIELQPTVDEQEQEEQPLERQPNRDSQKEGEHEKEEQDQVPLAIETTITTSPQANLQPSSSKKPGFFAAFAKSPSATSTSSSSTFKLLPSFRGGILGSRPQTSEETSTTIGKNEQQQLEAEGAAGPRAKTAPSSILSYLNPFSGGMGRSKSPMQTPTKPLSQPSTPGKGDSSHNLETEGEQEQPPLETMKEISEENEGDNTELPQQQASRPITPKKPEEQKSTPSMDYETAGLKVQLYIRKIVALKRLAQRRKEILQNQLLAASYVNWSAQSIQKVVRAKIGRKKAEIQKKETLRYREQKVQKSATKIQCLFRKLKAQTRVEKLRKLRDEERKRNDYIRSLQKKKVEQRQLQAANIDSDEEQEQQQAPLHHHEERKSEKNKPAPPTTRPSSQERTSSAGGGRSAKKSPSSKRLSGGGNAVPPPSSSPPRTPGERTNSTLGKPTPPAISTAQEGDDQPPTRGLTEADLKLHELEMKMKLLEDMEKRIKQSEEHMLAESLKAQEKMAKQMELLEEKAKQQEADRLAQQELMKLAVGNPMSTGTTPFATLPNGARMMMSNGGRPVMMNSTGPRPTSGPGANALMLTNGSQRPPAGIASGQSSIFNTQQLQVYPSHEVATLPHLVVGGQEWIQLYDDHSHAYYWWCEKLQLSQWEKPTELYNGVAGGGGDYNDAMSESGYAESVGGNLTDVSDQESAYYSESEAGDGHHGGHAGHGMGGINGSGWQEYWDEQAQAKYWYNNHTVRE